MGTDSLEALANLFFWSWIRDRFLGGFRDWPAVAESCATIVLAESNLPATLDVNVAFNLPRSP